LENAKRKKKKREKERREKERRGFERASRGGGFPAFNYKKETIRSAYTQRMKKVNSGFCEGGKKGIFCGSHWLSVFPEKRDLNKGG